MCIVENIFPCYRF